MEIKQKQEHFCVYLCGIIFFFWKVSKVEILSFIFIVLQTWILKIMEKPQTRCIKDYKTKTKVFESPSGNC